MIIKTGTVEITDNEVIAYGFEFDWSNEPNNQREVAIWAKNRIDKEVADGAIA